MQVKIKERSELKQYRKQIHRLQHLQQHIHEKIIVAVKNEDEPLTKLLLQQQGNISKQINLIQKGGI